MVNLLRLRNRAAYRRYSELAMPLIKARGGTVLWAGNGEAVAFGDAQADKWDYVVLVRYPSRAAFLDMMQSKEYAAANVHREQAIDRHVLGMMRTAIRMRRRPNLRVQRAFSIRATMRSQRWRSDSEAIPG